MISISLSLSLCLLFYKLHQFQETLESERDKERNLCRLNSCNVQYSDSRINESMHIQGGESTFLKKWIEVNVGPKIDMLSQINIEKAFVNPLSPCWCSCEGCECPLCFSALSCFHVTVEWSQFGQARHYSRRKMCTTPGSKHHICCLMAYLRCSLSNLRHFSTHAHVSFFPSPYTYFVPFHEPNFGLVTQSRSVVLYSA